LFSANLSCGVVVCNPARAIRVSIAARRQPHRGFFVALSCTGSRPPSIACRRARPRRFATRASISNGDGTNVPTRSTFAFFGIFLSMPSPQKAAFTSIRRNAVADTPGLTCKCPLRPAPRSRSLSTRVHRGDRMRACRQADVSRASRKRLRSRQFPQKAISRRRRKLLHN
jgi:hypothetical protein